jgi:hypothetical protein
MNQTPPCCHGLPVEQCPWCMMEIKALARDRNPQPPSQRKPTKHEMVAEKFEEFTIQNPHLSRSMRRRLARQQVKLERSRRA